MPVDIPILKSLQFVECVCVALKIYAMKNAIYAQGQVIRIFTCIKIRYLVFADYLKMQSNLIDALIFI